MCYIIHIWYLFAIIFEFKNEQKIYHYMSTVNFDYIINLDYISNEYIVVPKAAFPSLESWTTFWDIAAAVESPENLICLLNVRLLNYILKYWL